MTDLVLVVLTIALCGLFFGIVITRTVLAERATADKRANRGSPWLRHLDRAGVVVTVLLAAAVVLRVLNAVG
ncbi:MAG TPA: hypothetical protein VG674_12930 [Amycolatopsis sp.]|jgi:hypothetical protein|nr:hypothetical protein [Amycolatopsis sp.]